MSFMEKSVSTYVPCTNQQPPQRDGSIPDPVWVGSKWLLAFRGSQLPGHSPHTNPCMLRIMQAIVCLKSVTLKVHVTVTYPAFSEILQAFNLRSLFDKREALLAVF